MSIPEFQTRSLLYAAAVTLCAVMSSCNSTTLPEAVSTLYDQLPEVVDFNRDVKPILSDKCFSCHGPDEAAVKAGLQLNLPESAFGELKDSRGKYAIVPGDWTSSELARRILSEDPEYQMPQPESNLVLTDREKAVLIKWIDQGAEYKKHWAFLPLTRVSPPEPKENASVNNAIDRFIQDRLVTENMNWSSGADREILLRRLSLDITGLQPTIEEVNSFVNDNSPDAYEKQVDRLLASEAYGEQRTLEWMDLARYADTHGYSVDRYRDMSPWRDWVIESFNRNLPYDSFITYQLAGDLIKNPTREMRLATAFNRLHPQNMEGGIVNEEFLVEYAVDRTNTVSQAVLGLTTACARCHDHKYDPISQKEFYQLTAFFNNIRESGQISWNNATPVPTMLLSDEEEDSMMEYIDRPIHDEERKLSRLEDSFVDTGFENWLQNGKKSAVENREIPGLQSHFSFDGDVVDILDRDNKGILKRESLIKDDLDRVEGKYGEAIRFDGDSWLVLEKAGIFSRYEPFSVSLWAHIPSDLKDGNIFHKGDGAILYNWRGYHLRIRGDNLELMMAHTAPGNAIIKSTISAFPRDTWINIIWTYDGSSSAKGLKLFIDGIEQETVAEVDNLYKDILFGRQFEPPLQLGARWRGKGIKGAVLDEVKVFNREISPLETIILAGNNELLLRLSTSGQVLQPGDSMVLLSHFLQQQPAIRRQKNRLKGSRKKLAKYVEPIREISVMEEVPDERKTYLLERGVYTERKEEVLPGTPVEIFPMSADVRKDRLGLAKWIFDPDNPLTARVAVNRYWQYYFGTGLVETSEDFGNQGELPSHPELLDWLANYLIESEWDLKALQKLIVMSYTYKQSSVATNEALMKDPENRFLARGPSKRLTGEMLRDNVLLAGNLLSNRIGGPAVYPYQPEGLWRMNGGSYKEGNGEALYRRSMYTIWKRSVPHPTIATFDTPSRSVCASRRPETNTPLQALVLLNDPIFIEASRAIGMEMAAFKDTEQAVENAFRKLTGRTIGPGERDVLLAQFRDELEIFEGDIQKAQGWITTGKSTYPGRNVAKVAAYSVVASTIINSDPFITKR